MSRKTAATDSAMPDNWDDHAQWETYYKAYGQTTNHTNPAEVDNDLFINSRFVPFLLHQAWQKVWFPGCGVSIGPLLYVALGFEVWATDISQKAIQSQEEMQRNGLPSLDTLDKLRTQLPAEKLPLGKGSLHLVVHDFREPPVEGYFDCVLNMRAFQGLSAESMAQVAHAHWKALAPGRQAIFDTMNVQGERRTQMENALLKAGFYIPGVGAEQWYRDALDSTGIPYIFILGNPMRRWSNATQSLDEEARTRQLATDRETFVGLRIEYDRRKAEEMQMNEQLLSDGLTKIAQVVYSTG